MKAWEILLLVIAAVGSGVASFFNKKAQGVLQPAAVQVVGSICGAAFHLVIALPISLWLASKLSQNVWNGIIWKNVLFACLAGFPSSVAGFFMLSRADVSVVAPVVSSAPVVAALMGVVFLGESVSLMRAAGIVMAGVGVALVMVGGKVH
jgi:drug/metabolite transporter (DMT)-like permease